MATNIAADQKTNPLNIKQTTLIEAKFKINKALMNASKKAAEEGTILSEKTYNLIEVAIDEYKEHGAMLLESKRKKANRQEFLDLLDIIASGFNNTETKAKCSEMIISAAITVGAILATDKDYQTALYSRAFNASLQYGLGISNAHMHLLKGTLQPNEGEMPEDKFFQSGFEKNVDKVVQILMANEGGKHHLNAAFSLINLYDQNRFVFKNYKINQPLIVPDSHFFFMKDTLCNYFVNADQKTQESIMNGFNQLIKIVTPSPDRVSQVLSHAASLSDTIIDKGFADKMHIYLVAAANDAYQVQETERKGKKELGVEATEPVALAKPYSSIIAKRAEYLLKCSEEDKTDALKNSFKFYEWLSDLPQELVLPDEKDFALGALLTCAKLSEPDAKQMFYPQAAMYFENQYEITPDLLARTVLKEARTLPPQQEATKVLEQLSGSSLKKLSTANRKSITNLKKVAGIAP